MTVNHGVVGSSPTGGAKKKARRELVKLSVLENCGESPREVLDKLCEALGAEGVACVGKKIVLYRESTDNKTIILPR